MTRKDEVKPPHVMGGGTIIIGGETFTVYVLSDGRRIFSEDDFRRLLSMLEAKIDDQG